MFEKEKRYSFKQGLPKKAISTPYFTIRFGKSLAQSGTYAVVVSKKVSKKAVLRNKIKRRVLACLKENLSEKQEKVDLVIYIKPQIIELDEVQMDESIKETIIKI